MASVLSDLAARSSVVYVRDDWYPVCLSKDLRRSPVPVTLMGEGLVLFRDNRKQVGALLDRCAHRNVPLSKGRVRGPHLECFYHGWQFDTSGQCKRVPGLCKKEDVEGRRVPNFPVREQDGIIWVYGTPDVEPVREPYRFELLGSPGYTSVTQVVQAEGTLHATAENALDVPHTGFLHGGLFRSDGKRTEIEVVVKRWHDRVEAEYIGEPRPTGLVGRILSPKGGVVNHFDRFILPSIVEVEYRIDDTHFMSAAALTPIDEYRTQLFAVVSFKLPVPGAPLVPMIKPFANRIFRQDAKALQSQTDNIRRFGGETFMSTEVDVLGGHILKLLRNASRDERTPMEAPAEKRLTMEV